MGDVEVGEECGGALATSSNGAQPAPRLGLTEVIAGVKHEVGVVARDGEGQQEGTGFVAGNTQQEMAGL